MKQIDYNNYINTIECEDTIKFVQQMARYLYPDLNDNKNHMIYINPITKDENNVKQEEVKEFIAAYMAYLDLFDVQKEYFYQVKFNKPDRYQIANNIRKTHIIDVYKKYYHIFNPVNCDLRLLTPEDIIQATIKDIDKSDSYHQLRPLLTWKK